MFKITWDKENNGVLLTMKSSDEALNVPPRPIFFEELDLLGLNKHWSYPKSKEPLIWACDRRYFYRGELVLEAKGGNIYDDPLLVFTDAGKKLKLKPINVDLLCENNETTMFLLEHEALEFINTIYHRYRSNANQQIVNKAVDFQKLVEIQEKKQYPDLQFYLSKNHQDVLYYWDKMGSPSRIHRWCCSVMKSAPLSRIIKEIGGKDKQPNALLFDGVRAEESNNRARIGKNVKHNNIINVSPILYWNATEIYLYLLMRQLPINHGYRSELSRVGCVICPYFSNWSEDLCGKLYPNTAAPFIGKLRDVLTKSKVSGIELY